jgi:D-proline reductase (dithiol) PrdB
LQVAETDEPIRYMERTRLYYRALGYENDYVWATFDDVPFARLAKPLARARIALITTASPADLSNRDRNGDKHVWSGPVTPPLSALFTENLAWDKESTHMHDRGSYLPIKVASEVASEGVLGGLTARFHGLPTEYSQRKTMTQDAPEVLARLREDGADGAILCPI